MNRRQQLFTAMGVFISAVFLILAFRNLNPAQFVESLRGVKPTWLVVGVATFFVALTLITLRWQFLLRAFQFIPLSGLIPLVSIGYMGNNIYPLRSGEALRIYLLKRNYGVPIVKGTTTVLVERVFDGIVMLTFVIVPLAFIETTSRDIRRVATVAAPIFLVALAIFFGLALKPDGLRWLIKATQRFMPAAIGSRVAGAGEEVIAGLEGLRSPRHLAGAVGSSYASWMVEALVYWIVSFAFDLNVSYLTILLVVGTANLAGLIPASPSQIGVFEFFVRSVLVGAGVNAESALAFAVVAHMVLAVPVTIAGFLFLIRQGLNWRAVARARELEESAINTSHQPQKV